MTSARLPSPSSRKKPDADSKPGAGADSPALRRDLADAVKGCLGRRSAVGGRMPTCRRH
ncbi:hypothetical protein ACFPRL_20800 [Pseudoclavibacter helvolus]